MISIDFSAIFRGLFLGLLANRSPPVSPSQWNALNNTVNGRLHTTVPFARPCFQLSPLSGSFDETACDFVQSNYLHAGHRSDNFAAHMAVSRQNFVRNTLNLYDSRVNGKAVRQPTHSAPSIGRIPLTPRLFLPQKHASKGVYPHTMSAWLFEFSYSADSVID